MGKKARGVGPVGSELKKASCLVTDSSTHGDALQRIQFLITNQFKPKETS